MSGSVVTTYLMGLTSLGDFLCRECKSAISWESSCEKGLEAMPGGVRKVVPQDLMEVSHATSFAESIQTLA
jgi:hypothetical protein